MPWNLVKLSTYDGFSAESASRNGHGKFTMPADSSGKSVLCDLEELIRGIDAMSMVDLSMRATKNALTLCDKSDREIEIPLVNEQDIYIPKEEGQRIPNAKIDPDSLESAAGLFKIFSTVSEIPGLFCQGGDILVFNPQGTQIAFARPKGLYLGDEPVFLPREFISTISKICPPKSVSLSKRLYIHSENEATYDFCFPLVIGSQYATYRAHINTVRKLVEPNPDRVVLKIDATGLREELSAAVKSLKPKQDPTLDIYISNDITLRIPGKFSSSVSCEVIDAPKGFAPEFGVNLKAFYHYLKYVTKGRATLAVYPCGPMVLHFSSQDIHLFLGMEKTSLKVRKL